MKCFNCGNVLSNSDICKTCGEDVALYKRIVRLSNALYNDGLAKAKVRDLTGAAASLRQSLKLNKNNTDARNLLGLVNYEMGEVVPALSEWVMSKNLQKENNIAGNYIKAIQSNQNRLDTINQTIKKYNQALLYCRQGNEDLAVIQLKKVLSLNPRLIQGHLLLSLLYMKIEEYEKAAKSLNRVLKIDTANTTALRYMHELEKLRKGPQSAAAAAKVKENANRVAYRSGNDTIIQPTVRFRENTGLSHVINILIGLAVGAAVVWFLVVPGYRQSLKSEMNKAAIATSEEVATKTAEIASLKESLTTAQSESEAAKTELALYAGETGLVAAYENLLTASNAYDAGDDVAAAEALTKIDATKLTGAAKALYDSLAAETTAKAAKSLYASGYADYQKGNYAEAITKLSKVVTMAPSDADALYYLGRSYQKSGDTANANATFTKVIELFPGTKQANNAAANIK